MNNTFLLAEILKSPEEKEFRTGMKYYVMNVKVMAKKNTIYINLVCFGDHWLEKLSTMSVGEKILVNGELYRNGGYVKNDKVQSVLDVKAVTIVNLKDISPETQEEPQDFPI